MLTRTVRRYVIALSIVVFLVAVYAAAGFWAVPHFLRSGLTDFVATHYKRQLALGEIRFNPFTFTLDVSHFSLPDSDGQPLLAFGRLHVDLEVKSLFKLGPAFREIVLEQPRVRTVVRRDGTLNLADLGKGFASQPAPQPPPKPSQPMRLYIDRLAVIDGVGTFEDLSHATPFRAELKPIAFELRNFSTRAKPGASNNEYTLTASSQQGERLDWNGTILFEPLASHGTFAVSDLQANTIWNYLQQPLPLEIPSGIITVKGEYNFDVAGDAPAIKVDVHDTTVSDLKLRPKQGSTDYVVLSKLDIQETQVDVGKRSVQIGKVALAGGEVNAWLSPQGQLNLLELTTPAGSGGAKDSAGPQSAGATPSAPATAAPSGAAAAPAAALAAPAWTISVPDIAVENFKVSAEDRQVTPAFTLVMNPLDIHVAGYNTSPGTRVDVTAKTSINNGGSVNATAQLAPSGGDVAAHVELAELDLAMFQPFIAQSTAMTLQAGRLASKLDIKKGADGSLSVKGDVGVTGLRSVDELQQSFIRWKDLRVAGMQYDLQPASLRIDSITAREPYARVIIAPDRTVNVQQVLAGPKKGTPSLATQLGAAKAGKTLVGSKEAGAEVQAAAASAQAAAANAKDSEANAKAASAGADAAAAGKNATATHAQAVASSARAAAADAKAAGANANATVANATQKLADATAASADAGAKAGEAGSGSKSKHSRRPRNSQSAAVSAPSAPVMPISIRTVRIITGSVNYADFWIQPNFAVGIQALNGSIDGLSSDPKSRAKVKLDGKVDRYAPVTINGEMNLLAATVYSDIKMSFKGLELTTMTPYSGRFAGYKIDKGKLSVDLSYKVDQRKLTAEQRFVIDQLQLGDPVDSPDAVHLPLKLAVALLKDRNGVIDIPLPISGSLDDPQFKIGPIIWHAVVNLFVKVATAPFAALGRLFGGGHGEEMKYVDFAPGSADLDDASKQKLGSLSKALQEHTQLQLDVPIAFSKDIDAPVLARRRLDQRLIARAHSGKPPKKQAASGAAASGKRSDGTAQAATSSAGETEPPDPALADPLEHYRLLWPSTRQPSARTRSCLPPRRPSRARKTKRMRRRWRARFPIWRMPSSVMWTYPISRCRPWERSVRKRFRMHCWVTAALTPRGSLLSMARPKKATTARCGWRCPSSSRHNVHT